MRSWTLNIRRGSGAEPALEPFTEFTLERSERFEGKLREGFSMTLPKTMALESITAGKLALGRLGGRSPPRKAFWLSWADTSCIGGVRGGSAAHTHSAACV